VLLQRLGELAGQLSSGSVRNTATGVLVARIRGRWERLQRPGLPVARVAGSPANTTVQMVLMGPAGPAAGRCDPRSHQASWFDCRAAWHPSCVSGPSNATLASGLLHGTAREPGQVERDWLGAAHDGSIPRASGGGSGQPIYAYRVPIMALLCMLPLACGLSPCFLVCGPAQHSSSTIGNPTSSPPLLAAAVPCLYFIHRQAG